MLLPYLRDKVSFGTIVNQSGLSSKHVQTKFAFEKSSTDFEDLVGESENRGLLIGTRHHLHAPMVLSGLKANRHVFVEKPLCLTREELTQIQAAKRRKQRERGCWVQ